MMPKLTGVNVLKFIRGQASLADVPVVVLSNAYLTDLARQAEAAGVDKAFMKCNCTPAMLAETLDSLLNAQSGRRRGSTTAGRRRGRVGEAAPRNRGRWRTRECTRVLTHPA